MLVVEPSTTGRERLVRILGALSPRTVHAVSQGDHALALIQHRIARREPFDLVCIALGLPDMDGCFLLRRIRALEREADVGRTRVLMTTRQEHRRCVHHVLGRQADGWLAKPFQDRQVDRTLDSLGLTARELVLT